MDLLTRMNRVAFLGPEFLTWLWFRTETVGEQFQIDGIDEAVEVWFDDRLVVGSTMINAQENHFRGGHPPTSLEARSALRLGKLATEARLRLSQGAREWTTVLKATEMTCTGVKVPAVLSKEEDERFYERMYLLEELDMMMSGLFGQFLKLRMSERWTTHELPAVRTWVSGVDLVHQIETSAPKPMVTRRTAAQSEETVETNDRNTDLPPWEDPVGDVTK